MLSTNQELLLCVSAAALFHKPVNIPHDADWRALLQECNAQCVTLLVYPVINRYLPETEKQLWEQACLRIAGNNARVEWEHSELHKLMTENNIPYVAMKGCVSAAYYPDPSARTLGDVDFLVAPADLERAAATLEKAGFSEHPDADDRIHIAYHRARSIWEMHWEVNGIPDGDVGDRIRVCFKDMVADARIYESGGCTYMAPSAFHHGLVMLLHTAQHMINTGIGLRHLCDWAVFAGKLSDEEFRGIFEEKLKEIGLWRFAQLLTQVSTAYLGCPERRWAYDRVSADLEAIVADIFDGGNFGCKDEQRINQAKLMTNSGKGTVDDTPLLRQLIRTMNEKSRTGFPVCRKCALLLPVGWLVVGVRHLFRIALGKRPKIKINKMISGANDRKEIYKQFKLFTKE